MANTIQQLEAYLWSLGFILVAAAVGLFMHWLLFHALQRLARRRESVVGQAVPRHLRAPLRLLVPTLAVRISLPAHSLNLKPEVVDYLGTALSTLIIVSAAWLLIRLSRVMEAWILSRYDMTASDNLTARKVATQLDILRKIMVFIIVVFALSAVLMNFDNFRQIGTGLLASAGLAGLILGFAAQRTIANLLAGFQIALTQPIRIDDVVIVENEWGRIEEITLTYVVVAIWDKRRLVLPISYFLEKPFQNWTRTSSDLLGSVFLYVDYTLPIDEVRQHLGELLERSELWDGKVWRLHTTDTSERTVELRALMSATSASEAFELRCEIREKLIDYIQKHYPESLPRVRTDSESVAAEDAK